MEQQCPRCRLINPPEAVRCDCGWDFLAGNGAAARFSRSKSIADQAKASWVCPLVAWLSQFMIAMNMTGMRGLGLFLLAAALVQLVLLVVGLVLGIKIVTMDHTLVRPTDRKSAWAGVIFSGGTMALILAMFIAAMVG